MFKKLKPIWVALVAILIILVAIIFCCPVFMSPMISRAAEDPDDLGDYTSAAQNGRSVIFNLVDADNQIAESYNIRAVAAESGVPGTDPHTAVSFTVTSSARTSSSSHFNFSVTPGTYRTKVDKNGLYTILDLACTMTVPHHLRQSGVGDGNLPTWITDSSYVDSYPGGRFGAYSYNSQGCVGYAVFQLPRTPDGADRGNYSFHLQINIGNFRMNERTTSNDVAKKTYQFRYNKCAFLLNMGNCSVNEASGFSKGNGYLTNISTGSQVFIKNFDGIPNIFGTPETFGIYKPGYAFNCWQSTTDSSKTYKADGVTSYALESFTDHATPTTTVVNVDSDRPGQGWAGTTPSYTILQELQPVWNIVNYNITYTLNGGTVSGNPTTYNIETPTFGLNNPTKTGYRFLGWKGSNGSTPSTSVTVAQGTTGNLSFEAVWEPIVYNITYHLNGGTDPGNPVTYTIETPKTKLKNPTRRGYRFMGWIKDNGNVMNTTTYFGGGEIGNRVFSAHWERIDYNISYDLDGGTDPGNPTTYHVETPTFSLEEPTKEGYEFIGWTGSNGDTPEKTVTIEKGSIGDREYKAHWQRSVYNITYDLDGGTDPGNPTTYTANDEFTLLKPTKTGHKFLGWTGSNGTTPQEVVTIQRGTTGDLHFVANWESSGIETLDPTPIPTPPVPNTPAPTQASDDSYDISYDLNDGTDPGNPDSYTKDTPTFTLKNPTRKGYIFTGWIGSGIIGNPVKKVTIYQGTKGDLKFEAVWEPKSIKKLPTLATTKYINKGSTFTFKVYGANKKGYTEKWNNSNKKVLSLNNKGKAVGKKNGNTLVSYRLYNKKNQLVYGFRIKVKVITTKYKTLNTSKKISVNKPIFMFDKTLQIGKSFKLAFTNLEKNAKVTYKSSNKKVLTVSKNGVAKSKKNGFAYVTITLKQNGMTNHYRVHFKCQNLNF